MVNSLAGEIKSSSKQWTFNPFGPSGQLQPKSSFDGAADRNYSLKGSERPGTFLQWEDQLFGINLGWTDSDDKATEKKVRRWFFAKEGSGPVCYGDKISLANGRQPSYLYNTSRTVGIDLEWDDSPHYEWMLLGGKVGEPVKTGERLAIWNMRINEPLIHFDRTKGGDIGWPSSKTWGQHAKNFVKEAIKEALEDLLREKTPGQ